MNDPIFETRQAVADAMPAARFVKSTGNAGIPLEVKTCDAVNASIAGILMEANRFAGDQVRVAVGGGPVMLECLSAVNIDALIYCGDTAGRGKQCPLTSGTTYVGARALQSCGAAGGFISVMPVVHPCRLV